MSYLSNLDNDEEENESNPYKCFEHTKILDVLLKKRKRDFIEKKISPKNVALQYAKVFEEKYGVSFQNFFEEIKNKYKTIKKIDIISTLTIEMDEYLPILEDEHGFIFLNNSKNGLIFQGKIKRSISFITLESKNNGTIRPLKLFYSINLEEKFIYFVVKLN